MIDTAKEQPAQPRQALRRLALGLWCVVAPLAGLYLVARLEFTRVPQQVFAAGEEVRGQALDHAAALTWAYGSDFIVALWLLGAVLWWSRGRNLSWKLLLALCLVPLALVFTRTYQVLATDSAFASDAKIIGGLVFGVAATAALGVLVLMRGQLGAESRGGRLARLVAWVAPGTAFLAGLALWWLNYQGLQGLYAPLHLAGAQLSLFYLGLGLLFAAAMPMSVPTVLALALSVSGLPAAILAVAAVNAGDVDNKEIVHRYTNARTNMGQGRVVFEHNPTEAAAEAGGSLLSRNEATKLFDKYSGMPRLPPSFDLEDYNLLLVTIEATRWDKTSLHDPNLDTTPNLVAFGDRGATVFTRAYSPSSTTLQSMTSIMSMNYPSAAPLTLWRQPWSGQLRPESDTVAEILSQVGYDTWWVGHNHRSYFGKRIIGLDQGFDEVVHVGDEFRKAGVDDADAEIARLANDRIEKAAKLDKRFFGWVFFVSPHHKYVTHDTSKPHKTNLDRYLQEVRNADEALGRVLSRAGELGLPKNTVIIVTSDHGEQFGEHGGDRHSSGVFEELVHVPLLIHVPGMEGTIHTQPTSLAHLFAWLLKTSPGPMGDLSMASVRRVFAPALKATEGGVMVELLGKTLDLSGMIFDKEKFIYNHTHQVATIFDLEADPGEQTDLALKDLERAQRLGKLFEAYRKVRKKFERTKNKKKKKTWSKKDQAKLDKQMASTAPK